VISKGFQRRQATSRAAHPEAPRLRFHDLRHSALTALLDAGVPVHVVSKIAGHANVSVTLNIYSHALPDAKREAIDELAAAVFGGGVAELMAYWRGS
jgi:integrase